MTGQTASVLSVRGLRIESDEKTESAALVSGISFEVGKAEVLGLVGGSGSGKSLTVRACMRLLPEGLTGSGSVRFKGENLDAMGRARLMEYRTRDVGFVHQDARSSMDPRRTVGDFLLEAVLHSRLMTFDEAFDAARALLRDVGVREPERRMKQFPNELSGGLLQRMMIVAALLHNPDFIFADEPTSALDVIAQSDVMAILLEQVRDRGVGLLFITHDLDLAAASCDRLAVMREGEIVEQGQTADVTLDPQNPYTRTLLNARLGARAPGPVERMRGPVTIRGGEA